MSIINILDLTENWDFVYEQIRGTSIVKRILVFKR